MLLEITKMPYNISLYKVLSWAKIKNLKAAKVTLKEVDGIENIAWKMIKTCVQENGIGLAAVQIGILKQIIIIRNFETVENNTIKPASTFKVFLNPSWTFVNAEKVKSVEACLSVSETYPIERYKAINLKWEEISYNENNKPIFLEKTELFEDFRSIVAQHECDHLNGVSIPQRWQIQQEKK
jgi:peptide deformylase